MMSIRFGRAVVGNLQVAETREWLVTNGIGGYASGTVAGSLSRGYHGLLVAATKPPGHRRIILVKLDETLEYRGAMYDLGCNRWGSGAIAPAGHYNLQAFELEGSIPRWQFACADALIDKRIWMEHGANTTYVAYTVVAAVEPIQFSARVLVDNRVFHNTGQVTVPDQVQVQGSRVQLGWEDSEAKPLILDVSSGQAMAAKDIYQNFKLPVETHRGLRDLDDHVHAATYDATIAPGQTLLFVASTEADASPDPHALERRRSRDASLVKRWRDRKGARATQTPQWAEQLVLAADQFVVARPLEDQPDGHSIIAGYHWFEDWGRDTMVALPGLTLTTGRAEIAAPILKTFAQFVSEGMLPNRFPDGNDQPEYNTIDATFWYFQAISAYHEATGDDELVRSLFPTLRDIIDAHVRGTRYGIKVDPADGLLSGGEPSLQLTWMDAKVNDVVITPRMGKPVEVNALWYSALCIMGRFANMIGEPAEPYEQMAGTAREGFKRFWNSAAGFCYDVLDGPNGAEAALRPNQIFAVSLPDSPLNPQQQQAVVDACARALLTSHGLRSLAPDDPAFKGQYGGDQFHRDSAYHQGTVWGWLLGPFVIAHLRVYADADTARRFLEPIGDNLREAGIGTISEIFDGGAPFTPRGCIAQAWSVGEVLRALAKLEEHAGHADPDATEAPTREGNSS